MRIRIVTFALTIPAVDYTRHAMEIAPEFGAWPGLLGKWWLGDAASGTYGGVYLFASQEAADRSRDTDLFRGMYTNPAFRDVTVREFGLLDAPTAITGSILEDRPLRRRPVDAPGRAFPGVPGRRTDERTLSERLGS